MPPIASRLDIAPAQPYQDREALELVLSDLAEPARGQQIARLVAQSERSADTFEGLMVATRGSRVVAAGWARLESGRTAMIYPPYAKVGDSDACEKILAAMLDFCGRRGARTAQSLISLDHGPAADCLRAGGLAHLTDLVYLVSLGGTFPDAPPAGPLEFVTYDPAIEDRYGKILERTYEDTHDCPELNGVRSTADTLDGYRATGRFDPRLWLLATLEGHDVGCLLMTEHEERVVELIYMGLARDVRGRGLGLDLVRQGQWRARTLGAERMVVAVDARNERALAVYGAAGFVGWDRRSVFFRALS